MMLRVENINKYYRVGDVRLHILKGITFKVKTAEFLTVRGPSGAGKSTLLHAIGGLEKPEQGNIYLEEDNIYSFSDVRLSKIRNEKIGFVFQFYYLIPELNLLENVAIPLLIRNLSKKEVYRLAKDMLKFLGLESRIAHFPNQLSGGEQQRAAIARALITNPRLLLCDEPTGNLDSQMGQEVLQLLGKINRERETTIIIVTHDKEVASWSKREIYIKDGMQVNSL